MVDNGQSKKPKVMVFLKFQGQVYHLWIEVTNLRKNWMLLLVWPFVLVLISVDILMSIFKLI